jgi:hypothetical protein
MGIETRDEGNAKRKDRLAKIKKGPGVFVYNGGAFDTDWAPTPMLVGAKVPKLDEQGMPVRDRAGRQVYERAGEVVRDLKGQPVLGGEPSVERKPMKTFVVRGKEFPAGKQVVVDDPTLALKLRCMSHFDEVEAGAVLEVEAEPDEKHVSEMTKAELLEAAKALGHEVPSGMSKAELVELLSKKS